MNIIKTIKKAAKAVVRTFKEIIDIFKTNYEVKKAKVKAWHEYKKETDSEYFETLVTIVIALIKILLPMSIARTATAQLTNRWSGYFE